MPVVQEFKSQYQLKRRGFLDHHIVSSFTVCNNIFSWTEAQTAEMYPWSECLNPKWI